MTTDSKDHQEQAPDPLIEEVRARRRELSERFGNDVDRLCDHLAEIERQQADRVVRPERREVPISDA